MKTQREVTLFETQDCVILDSALRTYLAELRSIREICKKDVMIDGTPIEKQIAQTIAIKQIVHARLTEDIKWKNANSQTES